MADVKAVLRAWLVRDGSAVVSSVAAGDVCVRRMGDGWCGQRPGVLIQRLPNGVALGKDAVDHGRFAIRCYGDDGTDLAAETVADAVVAELVDACGVVFESDGASVSLVEAEVVDRYDDEDGDLEPAAPVVVVLVEASA